MERVKKSKYVALLKKKFEKSAVIIAVTQNKLTVSDVEKLRKRMKAHEAEYFVIKNTLAKLAVEGTMYNHLSELFKGQTAIVFSNSAVDACKVIMDFASETVDKVSVIGGAIGEEKISVDYIKMLSKLPSMDEIRAKIIAIIQTPGGQLARALKAYSEK